MTLSSAGGASQTIPRTRERRSPAITFAQANKESRSRVTTGKRTLGCSRLFCNRSSSQTDRAIGCNWSLGNPSCLPRSSTMTDRARAVRDHSRSGNTWNITVGNLADQTEIKSRIWPLCHAGATQSLTMTMRRRRSPIRSSRGFRTSPLRVVK